MKITLLLFFFTTMAYSATYPPEWWKPVPREGAPAWEILPQDAAPGEVILSKRNELGILSNFAPTPFSYRGKAYASVEGLWQMMKYPEDNEDPRMDLLPPIREKVAGLSSFEAKEAGNLGSKAMKQLGIGWVSFEGIRIPYCSLIPGEHYRIIREAMVEKLRQNPEVRRVLKLTGDLKLRPDHLSEGCRAPEWNYHEIWMELRSLEQ